jgi:hypothetical protein
MSKVEDLFYNPTDEERRVAREVRGASGPTLDLDDYGARCLAVRRRENDEARQILTVLLCHGPELLQLDMTRELRECLEDLVSGTQAWSRKWTRLW